MADASRLAGLIDIDSAGTTGAHSGSAPDPRAIDVALRRGYDLAGLRARQVSAADFELCDYIVAMDMQNVRYLKSACPPRMAQKIELLLDYGGEEDELEVPDPYYGAIQDFEHSLELIEEGCRGLLEHLTDLYLARGVGALKREA